MKKRTIALVLVLALSLLTFISCGDNVQKTREDNVKKLIDIMFNCPNEKLMSEMRKGGAVVGEGVTSEISVGEPSTYPQELLGPYISLDKFDSVFISLIDPYVVVSRNEGSKLEVKETKVTKTLENGNIEIQVITEYTAANGEKTEFIFDGRVQFDAENKVNWISITNEDFTALS